MRRLINIICVVATASALLMLASCGTTTKGTVAHRATSTKGTTAKAVVSPKKQEAASFTMPANLDFSSQMLLKEARSWLGTPYKFGGEDADGVDCSGFVTQVYLKALDIKLPRNSAKQQEFCSPISREELTPGDLVFFTVKGGRDVGHVGIYVGEGKMIHSSSSKGVIVSALSQKYYTDNFHSCGRIGSLKAATKTKSTPTVAEKKPAAPRVIATTKVTPGPATARKMEENRQKALDALLTQVEDSIYGQ